jgi:hypothetical protein
MKTLLFFLAIAVGLPSLAQSNCDKPSPVVRDSSGAAFGDSFRLTETLKIQFAKPENCKSFESYQLLRATLILVRGTTRVATVQATTELVDVSKFIHLKIPGDKLMITVESFKGITKDGAEKIFNTRSVLSLPLN